MWSDGPGRNVVPATRRSGFHVASHRKADAVERKRVLCRLGELVASHGAELALLDSLDMGKRVANGFSARYTTRSSID
ncbi:hypothetical protein CUJ89_36660 [Burkholderia pyrrocinia]|uniref:Uncharacterized protein n=1 Tax=Burkholderia pyrrocinia TaxID=60550 RepID=A0A2Z5N8L9_BURPY|nr:hypothetical protein [Burkholderia pyrrocinia]AXF25931.1 hypothetical protein CUJ89_36660 [Burkholderia pyrrocinia]